MASPLDFRCEECWAQPSAPCVYLRPTNEEFLTFTAERKDYSDSYWLYIRVAPRRGEVYEETVRKSLESYRYLMSNPAADIEDALQGLSPRWRQVGKPLRSKPCHNARLRALSSWETWSENQAMAEYLREWLGQFGDIFQEAK